jgi:hypothetical protein
VGKGISAMAAGARSRIPVAVVGAGEREARSLFSRIRDFVFYTKSPNIYHLPLHDQECVGTGKGR